MSGPLSFIGILLALLLGGELWVGFALMALGILSLEIFRTMRIDSFPAGDIWATAKAQGFDPVWFGIFLVITIEMAQVTPPVGFNLFVIRTLTGEGIGRIALAAAPFCALMVLIVAVLTIWPGIVTSLPESMC